MADFILNDTTNNITYMNFFDALTNGIVNPSIDLSSLNLRDACIARWGASTAVLSSLGANRLWCISNSINETKTNRVASTSNYRFTINPISIGLNSIYTFGELNSNSSTGQTIIANNANTKPGGAIGGTINSYEYAIVTNNNVSCAGFASDGTNLNTATWRFVSAGWLVDSPFSTANIQRSLYQLLLTPAAGVNKAYRVSSENLTVEQVVLVTGLAQYPITCVTSGLTPSDTELWCTDLWLRDSPSGYAVGRIPHVLMTNNNTLNLGELVYIDTVIDGITNQKIWLVVANYGTRRLLMRVQTENIVAA